jgi:hypothetical protein
VGENGVVGLGFSQLDILFYFHQMWCLINYDYPGYIQTKQLPAP